MLSFAPRRLGIHKMSTYADRLAEGLSRPGKTRTGLALSMGVSGQAVGQLLNGQSKSATAVNNALAASYLECDPDWLATGRGAPHWGVSGHFSTAGEPPATYKIASTPDIKEAVLALGQLLSRIDELNRAAIAPLLVELAKRPEEAERISRLVRALADSEPKA